MTPRNMLIGKVHALAKQLGYDEATYRTVLLTQTGKTSCREMSDAQLSQLANALERIRKGKRLPEGGYRPANAPKALGSGQPTPTLKQWETLTGLAQRAGWGGLEDFRMLGFARRTAKVAELGELTRAQMSKVITGMTRMLAQDKARSARGEA